MTTTSVTTPNAGTQAAATDPLPPMLIGVAFAGVLLGEELTLALLGAAVLCAGGLWLINRR